MQIEEKIPEESIDNILKDPKKYRKMMLILQQTLYDLGYHESAKMLETQTQVSYYTQQLLQIKTNLQRNDYEGAIRVVQALVDGSSQEEEEQKNTQNHNHMQPEHKGLQNSTKLQRSTLAQIKSMIYETYCMHKIINNQFDSAMKIISQKIENQTKKQSLCQALVLGNHHVTCMDLERYIFEQDRKKNEIFKFCLGEYQQIGEREIEKVIQSYSQHEGEYNKELKGLLTSQKRLPPMKILTVEFSSQIKHTITHLRINPANLKVILIEENKETQLIHILQMNKKNYDYQKQMSESGHLSLKLKYPIFTHLLTKSVQFMYKTKRQSIESLAINNSKQTALIAISSFNLIQIYSQQLQLLHRIQSPNKIEKYLHIEFHPISELLYNCGYFETMTVLDAMGQQVMSIYPYPKTRKFKFYQNQVIGISLVTNKVYKHSLDQQVLVNQRELDDGVMPMDLCIEEQTKRLAVSSLQFLYLIDLNSFQILGKTTSPTNPNKLIIQVKFYNDFLITLCKNFTGYELQQQKANQTTTKLVTLQKTKQWSGDGTFDIFQNIMVSGMKEILVWQEGDLESQMEEESQFYQERLEQSLLGDLQNLQEDSMSSDSELSNSIEEEEDDSIDEDQDIEI